MSGERKLWTAEEDQVLKELRDKGIKKWSVIARIMEEQYKILGRSGKQCRERWFNRLDPKINSEEWSVEDDRKLFKLHDELGNSWVRISKEFKGRTDNSIKNHFYSILRKAIRKINKFISSIENDDSDIRILGTGLVSKIVSAADDKFDKKLFLPSVLIEKAHELKNKLVPYADCSREDQWNNTTKVIKLINDLHTFQEQYSNSEKLNKKNSHTKSRKEPVAKKQQVSEEQEEVIQEEQLYQQKNVKVHFNKQDFFKKSSSFGEDFLHDFSKRSSGSIVKARSSMEKSSFEKSEFGVSDSINLLKRLSSYSGMSSLGHNLFPQMPSYEWDRQALMNSVNNIHGEHGELPGKEEFLYENLDRK